MIFMAAFLFVGIVACGGKTTEAPTTEAPTTQGPTTQAPTTVAPTTLEPNELPVIAGVDNVQVTIGEDFDPLDGVTATDEEDGSLTSITYTGTLDLTTAGEYTLTYSVTDSDGGVGTATRVVTVVDVDVVYPTGFFNFKFATTELRHTFMAAAERYLLDTMYGGVPLFANGSFALYSDRLQFPVNEYIPIMGWGAAFGTMSADDSTVLMDNEQYGNAGEYTYRTASTTNPENWNQWLYQTSTDSDFMGLYYDALYVYEFNEDKTSYAVNPSMASGNPIPVNSYVTETGKEVSKTWRIPVRTDLEWYYHPDTDTSALPAGHEVIDANDFVNTFKFALDEGWFRAISGGGDFITANTKIQNAKEYRDGDVTWEEVGIKAFDDNTIELVFVDDQSEWNVRYFLSSFVMTPVNLELYAALQDGDNNSYGTSNTTIAYHGPYYVDYYEEDKVLRYKKNPNFHTPDMYFYTGYSFMIIAEAEVRFQEFLAGKLEGVGLPVADYEEYKDHPGIKQSPGATTFRMMINGLGTVENQRAQFPGGTWVPEPILANQDFKKAMFFVIDRQNLAEEVLKTSTTNMFLFSNIYMVDAELYVPYRETAQGISVGDGLSPSTFGYNADAAVAYWELAIDALVASGAYTPGTAAAYNHIELDFNIFSGSEAQVLMGEYIKAQFETYFTSSEHYIDVKLTVVPKDFPGIYYDYMMTGEFDLSIGGISGSTLDAASFLDVFCDDNRGGFTLNWGIDTSVAEVEVRYFDFGGEYHREMWSFNAITAALNGLVYVQDGEEIDTPSPFINIQSNVAVDATPTSVPVTIREYTNVAYENLTYTVQYYDLAGDVYVDLDGYVNIPVPSANFDIDGLEPYFYHYGPNGSLVYKGDYQIVLSFEYAEDNTKVGTTTSQWFMLPAISEYSSSNGVSTAGTFTPTDAVVDLGIHPDYTATLTSIDVLLYADNSEVTTANVDFSDLSATTVDGLTPGTVYMLVLNFDDGNWEVIRIRTAAAMTAEVTATETGATIVATINGDDGVTRLITDAVVYLAADDTEVTAANVDFTNPAAIAVTGLTAETEYYVEFTLDDGSVVYVDVTTEAAPVE
jgi:ABC-type oligopeptide transport system substrate-binding subunit